MSTSSTWRRRWKALPGELDPRVRQLVVRLRRLVDRSGLSLRQLAAETGYSAYSWERYLGGRRLPPRGAVKAMARIGGADPTGLLALYEVAAQAWGEGRAGTPSPDPPETTGAVTLRMGSGMVNYPFPEGERSRLLAALRAFQGGDTSHLRVVHRTKGTAVLRVRFELPQGVLLELTRQWEPDGSIVFTAEHLIVGTVIIRHGVQQPRTVVAASARRTTSAASWIAGQRHSRRREEWAAVLAGDSGEALTRRRQIALARGFVIAAVRMRARDAAAPFWRLVDWTLSTDKRTDAFVAMPPGGLTIYIAHQDGLHTLLTEGWGWTAGCGLAVFSLTRWMRRRRGIELATPTRPDEE